jgi:hypothetical protein
MSKVSQFIDAKDRFNEKVLNDNLSDEIVKRLWERTDLAELVNKEGLQIVDICILLKCSDDGDEIAKFRFEIEVAIEDSFLSDELCEFIADRCSELFDELAQPYSKEIKKVNDAYEHLFNFKFEDHEDFRTYVDGWMVKHVQ